MLAGTGMTSTLIIFVAAIPAFTTISGAPVVLLMEKVPPGLARIAFVVARKLPTVTPLIVITSAFGVFRYPLNSCVDPPTTQVIVIIAPLLVVVLFVLYRTVPSVFEFTTTLFANTLSTFTFKFPGSAIKKTCVELPMLHVL